MRSFLLTLLAILVAFAAFAASEIRSGVWTAELDSDGLSITIFQGRHRHGPGFGNMMSLTVQLPRLTGLSADAVTGGGADVKFALVPDDTKLFADGADTTRVVLRVTDEFDRIRPFANDAVKFELDGPAKIIGDNPFALIGGTGAIWIRAKEQAGTVTLTATHPQLGKQQLQFEIAPAAPEVA